MNMFFWMSPIFCVCLTCNLWNRPSASIEWKTSVIFMIRRDVIKQLEQYYDIRFLFFIIVLMFFDPTKNFAAPVIQGSSNYDESCFYSWVEEWILFSLYYISKAKNTTYLRNNYFYIDEEFTYFIMAWRWCHWKEHKHSTLRQFLNDFDFNSTPMVK